MPRQSRLDAPGVLHHVMGRGIEKRNIFINDVDRHDFIERLALLSEDGAWDLYAWALLPNHFHLLCKTRKRPLPSSMRKLLTGYVVNFNRRHRRLGLGRRIRGHLLYHDLGLSRAVPALPGRAGPGRISTRTNPRWDHA